MHTEMCREHEAIKPDVVSYALLATDFRGIHEAVEFICISSDDTQKMMHKFIPCLPDNVPEFKQEV